MIHDQNYEFDPSIKVESHITDHFEKHGQLHEAGPRRYLYKDGDLELQEGVYLDANSLDGYVRIIYSNGDYYIGGYANGKFQGKGMMVVNQTGEKRNGVWN